MGKRWIFDGHIAGLGTSSGLRAVVGVWHRSPFGAFSDVMVQQPSGRRLLLAPSEDIAVFIAATYAFDDVALVDVSARLEEDSLGVDAGPLAVSATIGSRTLLGRALRVVPRPLAVHPRWLGAVSPLARVLSGGSRTSGTAGRGRREYYGVTDLHDITSAVVCWNGTDAGELSPIRPAVTFGFSSVPPQPGLARVRTTITEVTPGRPPGQPQQDSLGGRTRSWGRRGR